jgi:hypothetical protein
MDKNEPLLRLVDGNILRFEDKVFGACGGCETYGFGGEPDTDLIVYYTDWHTEKYFEYDGVNGSRALTFVMRNLEQIKLMTLKDFDRELGAYLDSDD